MGEAATRVRTAARGKEGGRTGATSRHSHSGLRQCGPRVTSRVRRALHGRYVVHVRYGFASWLPSLCRARGLQRRFARGEVGAAVGPRAHVTTHDGLYYSGDAFSHRQQQVSRLAQDWLAYHLGREGAHAMKPRDFLQRLAEITSTTQKLAAADEERAQEAAAEGQDAYYSAVAEEAPADVNEAVAPKTCKCARDRRMTARLAARRARP